MSKRGLKDYSVRASSVDWKTLPVVYIASFDIGTVNFCFRIEIRRPSGSEILTHDMRKFSLGKESYLALFKFLEANMALFNMCHVFVIERQHDKNNKAEILMYTLLTWLRCRMYDSEPYPYIVTISPNMKYQMLGCGDMSHASKKNKWGPAKARELLTLRNDRTGLAIFDAQDKKDDVADVVLQIEALYVILKLNPTPQPLFSQL